MVMDKAEALDAPRLGLALSGGGVRAAVFHLGLLRCLAERGMMERVEQLSTVSGGSLIIAAIVSTSGMKWPSSRDYHETVYPALRRLLTSSDLFSLRALGIVGLIRQNIRLFNQRAQILVDLLEEQWKITGALRDLPEVPRWWINATCFETAKNWRFSNAKWGIGSLGGTMNRPSAWRRLSLHRLRSRM